MSLAAIKKLRTYIKADAALAAWCTAHYGKPLRHLIGYKNPVNANDYPAICYVPVRAKRGEQPNEEEMVSIVIGVNEKEMVDDVFVGVERSAEAAKLIVGRLLIYGSSISIKDDVITETTDLGTGHPFYESELQFVMLVEPSTAVDDAALAAMDDFVTIHADYDVDPHQPQAEHIKWAEEPPDYTTSAPELTDTTTLPQ
jgi:hypothetical protein